jgi:hypothetical protein
MSFSVSNCAPNDLHLREDDTGNVLVRELVVLVLRRPEQSVRQSSTSGNGDRRQQNLAGNVSNGVNVFNVGVLVFIGDNVSSLFRDLDVDVFEAKLFSVGVTADGPQQNIDLDGLIGGIGVHQQTVGGLFDFLDVGVLVDVDSRFLYLQTNTSDPGPIEQILRHTHVFRKNVLEHWVESPQDLLVTDHQVGLRAKRMEDTGQLDSDVSGTDNGNSLRLLFDVEETVRVDTV